MLRQRRAAARPGGGLCRAEGGNAVSLLRIVRCGAIAGAVGAGLAVLLAVGVGVHGVLYWAISERLILDRDDRLVLAVPQGGAAYMRLGRGAGVFSAPDSSGQRLFDLTPRAVVYETEARDEWTRVDLYGWVWAASVVEQASILVLADSLRAENLRADANGIIIARILPGTELVPLFTSDKGTWRFCRASGWINSRALTGADPGRRGSGMYPVETDFTGLGGESLKRAWLKRLFYTGLPFVAIFLPLGAVWSVSRLRRRRRCRNLRASEYRFRS